MIFLEEKKLFLFKSHGSLTYPVGLESQSLFYLATHEFHSQVGWNTKVSACNTVHIVCVGSQFHKNLFKYLENCQGGGLCLLK